MNTIGSRRKHCRETDESGIWKWMGVRPYSIDLDAANLGLEERELQGRCQRAKEEGGALGARFAGDARSAMEAEGAY
jgi:hypothetical protein